MAPGRDCLLAGLIRDPETETLLGAPAEVAALLEVEAALALAEADCGLIPAEAAARIADAARLLTPDLEALKAGMGRDGVPIPALVAALRQAVPAEDAGYVHWGATSQDIVDTALVLRLARILDLFETRLRALALALGALAEAHRATPIAARTRMQQATPTSFGLKVAGWMLPLTRHLDRLAELRPRLLAVSLGGASGNLAALGPEALAVEARLAARLKLTTLALPWHTARDTMLELGGLLALITGSLGKMGQDVVLLAQNEIGEVSLAGSGGSSTMPNKANPVAAEVLIALARSTGGLAGVLNQAALAEQERSGAAWLIEQLHLPDMLLQTGAALATAADLVADIRVNEAAMRATFEAAHGLMLAEAASFALADHMPRSAAQALVKTACAEALASGQPLIDVLRAKASAPIDWDSLKDPARHMGAADALIDRALGELRRG